MKKAATILIVSLSLLWSATGRAQNGTRTWNRKTFLEALDEASKSFRTLTANIEMTKVTKVINLSETESGRLFYRKDNRIKIAFEKPNPKEVLFDGKRVQIYYPEMKRIDEYNMSKHKDLLEQFLLLGFGTSGGDLNDAYLVTVLGETRMEGRPALEVKLTPRDDKIRNSVHEIRIWFDLGSWAPLQQVFFEVGGDTTTTKYKDLKVNVPISRSQLNLSAPSNTARHKPQGGF